MLEFINEFRNAPERRYAIFGVKTFARLTNGYGGKSRIKNALMDLKCAKSGSLVCEKEMTVRLCDLYAIMVAAGLVMAVVSHFKSKSKDD